MNHAGEISTLVAIAEPDVRVWTNVGDAHLGFFASPDAIADAKAEILERADRDDVLVCNADDPRVMARAARLRRPDADVRHAPSARPCARATSRTSASTACARASSTPAGERVIETPLLGRGNLSNVLAGDRRGARAGVPLDDDRRRARRGCARPIAAAPCAGCAAASR